MGIEVYLIDEKGKTLQATGDDRYFSLEPYLPDPEDERSICLRFVDPYGDTYFNRAQMTPLMAELAEMRSLAKSDYDRKIIGRIEELWAPR